MDDGARVADALWSDVARAEAEVRLARMLTRAYELAVSHLDGINEAALELADIAGDDGRVMERAVRVVAARVEVAPTRVNKQVASLVRRAIELGMDRWTWADTKPVP